MSTGSQQLAVETAGGGQPLSVTVYSHSSIYYWWPVWLTAFTMALLTYLGGQRYEFRDKGEAAPVVEQQVPDERQEIERREAADPEQTNVVKIHPNKNLGVIFTVVLCLVFLMTNVTLRGMASALVIASILIITLFLAYMGWWDDILSLFGDLSIHMNMGFYFFFGLFVFLIWLGTVFGTDRLRFWTFRPGQVVYNRVWGGAERTFDTRGASVYKHQDDLFRHWVLGLGSGDIHLATTGAESTTFDIKNVLFVGAKLNTIQKLVALKPDEFSDMYSVTTGQPE